jgi:hypothetical protein
MIAQNNSLPNPTATSQAPCNDVVANQDIADYIRGLATDLERLSQQAGLSSVAACLRAAAAEAKRAKNDARLLKLGVTPDRRLG